MGRRGFVLVSLVGFVNAVARTGALFNVIPILARDRLALSTDRIGLGLALASVVGLALAYPAGVLVDRYGRKTVIVPSTALAGVSLVLFLLAPSYAWFLVGCVAWSAAAGVSGAAPATYAADVAPAGMNAAAISGYRMLSDLGYVIGPHRARRRRRSVRRRRHARGHRAAARRGVARVLAPRAGELPPEPHLKGRRSDALEDAEPPPAVDQIDQPAVVDEHVVARHARASAGGTSGR